MSCIKVESSFATEKTCLIIDFEMPIKKSLKGDCYYTGKEVTPKGDGFCANLERVGSVMSSNKDDDQLWQALPSSTGRLKWYKIPSPTPVDQSAIIASIFLKGSRKIKKEQHFKKEEIGSKSKKSVSIKKESAEKDTKIKKGEKPLKFTRTERTTKAKKTTTKKRSSRNPITTKKRVYMKKSKSL